MDLIKTSPPQVSPQTPDCYQGNPISCCAVWIVGDKNGTSRTKHRTFVSSLPVKPGLLASRMKVRVFLMEYRQPSLPWTDSRKEACRWQVGALPFIKTHAGHRCAGEAHPLKGLPLRPLTCSHTPAQVWKVPTEGFPGSSWKLASHSEVKVAQLWAPHSHLTPCKVAQLACPRYCPRSSFIFHFIFRRHLGNLTTIISISNGLVRIREGKLVSPSEFTKPIPRATSIKEKLILIKKI